MNYSSIYAVWTVCVFTFHNGAPQEKNMEIHLLPNSFLWINFFLTLTFLKLKIFWILNGEIPQKISVFSSDSVTLSEINEHLYQIYSTLLWYACLHLQSQINKDKSVTFEYKWNETSCSYSYDKVVSSFKWQDHRYIFFATWRDLCLNAHCIISHLWGLF